MCVPASLRPKRERPKGTGNPRVFAACAAVVLPLQIYSYLPNLPVPPPPPKKQQTETELQWTSRSDVYEYGSAANPEMAPIPVLVHPPTLHESGPTRVIPFDIDDYLEIDSQVRVVLRVSQIQALFYRSW